MEAFIRLDNKTNSGDVIDRRGDVGAGTYVSNGAFTFLANGKIGSTAPTVTSPLGQLTEGTFNYSIFFWFYNQSWIDSQRGRLLLQGGSRYYSSVNASIAALGGGLARHTHRAVLSPNLVDCWHLVIPPITQGVTATSGQNINMFQGSGYNVNGETFSDTQPYTSPTGTTVLTTGLDYQAKMGFTETRPDVNAIKLGIDAIFTTYGFSPSNWPSPVGSDLGTGFFQSFVPTQVSQSQNDNMLFDLYNYLIPIGDGFTQYQVSTGYNPAGPVTVLGGYARWKPVSCTANISTTNTDPSVSGPNGNLLSSVGLRPNITAYPYINSWVA